MGIKVNNKFFNDVKNLSTDIYLKYGFKLTGLVFLSVLVASTEGLSMLLLLPLLVSMGIEVSTTSKLNEFFIKTFSFFGFDGSIVVITLFLLVIIIFQLSLAIIFNWKLAKFQRDYGAYWSKKILSSYFFANWEMLTKQKLGDFTNLITHETSRLSGAFMTLMQIVSAIITILIYVFISFFISYKITLCILFVALILFLSVRRVSNKNYQIGNELGPLTSYFTVKITEYFSNIKLIKVTATEKDGIDEINEIIDKLKKKHTFATFLPTLVRAFFEFGAFLSLCFILIFSYDFLKESTASILVIVALFIRLLPKFNVLQQSIQFLGNYLPAYEFIKNKVNTANKYSEKENLNGKKNKLLPNRIGNLNLNIKKAGYDNFNIIKDVNIHFPKTGLIGIVGHSGAGKSTLVNSILGLTKIYEGNISIGKILINETPIQDWRSLIGYIPQEIMLFNTTIFENIIWAKKNASKNEVIKCAKQAQAHDFIMEKKDGYFTHIGDKGTVLSGGQKQRIAIARALITRPKILIMDESTNSLDYDSEMKINKTIEILKKTTCVIVISHKINNLKNADKIIFMKNGKVEEQDSWDKLIKLKKNFYDFVKKYEVKR